MWQKCVLRHVPTFFCCSLVKSEPSWPRPEELKFEKKKNTAVPQILTGQPHETFRWKYWHISYIFPGGTPLRRRARLKTSSERADQVEIGRGEKLNKNLTTKQGK